MALSDLPGDLPGNLSRRAVDDLIRILRRSAREFGVLVARRSRDRLLARIRSVEAGTAMGHRRQDVQPRHPAMFVNEDPWVISSIRTPDRSTGSSMVRGISRRSSADRPPGRGTAMTPREPVRQISRSCRRPAAPAPVPAETPPRSRCCATNPRAPDSRARSAPSDGATGASARRAGRGCRRRR